jgi:GMP synthase-like glutamine amidotransferase
MGKIAIVRNDKGYVGQYITSRLANLLQNKCIIINAWEAFPQDIEKWALQENIKGTVLIGSLDSVNDKYKWIEEELIFIGDLINQEIPTLGICFGHQL